MVTISTGLNDCLVLTSRVRKQSHSKLRVLQSARQSFARYICAPMLHMIISDKKQNKKLMTLSVLSMLANF